MPATVYEKKIVACNTDTKQCDLCDLMGQSSHMEAVNRTLVAEGTELIFGIVFTLLLELHSLRSTYRMMVTKKNIHTDV